MIPRDRTTTTTREPTPAEREAAARRVEEAKRRAIAAGDPLNLTGHTRLTRRQESKNAVRRRQFMAKHLVTLKVRGESLTFDLRGNPVIAIYKSGELTASHLAAAATIQQDFDAVERGGLRAAVLRDAVDGGRVGGAVPGAIDAVRRLRWLREKIGDEHYFLLAGVIGHGLSFSKIHAKGGDQNRVISQNFRRALDRAATALAYQPRESASSTLRALNDLMAINPESVTTHRAIRR